MTVSSELATRTVPSGPTASAVGTSPARVEGIEAGGRRRRVDPEHVGLASGCDPHHLGRHLGNGQIDRPEPGGSAIEDVWLVTGSWRVTVDQWVRHADRVAA